MDVNRLTTYAAWALAQTLFWVAPIIAKPPQFVDRDEQVGGGGSGPIFCSCSICQGRLQQNASFLDRQRQKIGDLTDRRYQLSQHVAYDSPLESSYYFRPYQWRDIEKQQQFVGFSKNPYDNRMFESLYTDQPRVDQQRADHLRGDSQKKLQQFTR